MATAAKRPVVSIYSAEKNEKVGTTALPEVLVAPIRLDIVHRVHTNIRKNKRQPYAVAHNAGMQYAAESWGTGRAVSRIPRVPGGGTHAAGSGAFGNMCRGGRMFAPTKVWRKWHKKTNLNERRVAVASALAATAVPALVMARGHKIDAVNEVPLVISNNIETLSKVKDAIALLKTVNAFADVEKSKDSKKIRAGAGKARNRRYTQRLGPLVVFNEDRGISKGFRNISGVEVANVNSLNLLQLAPGGHLGRFVIFSQAAFEKLDSIFGTYTKESAVKKGFTIPFAAMANADVARIINSDEVQSKIRAAKESKALPNRKVNPLKSKKHMAIVNPYAAAVARAEALAAAGKKVVKAKLANVEKKRKAGDNKATVKKSKKAVVASFNETLASDGTEPAANFLVSYNNLISA